jgi:hypothetical protein
MINQCVRWTFSGRQTFLDGFQHLDKSKLARFFVVAIAITPLVLLTRWLTHGDVPIPLFRIFFAGMYTLFGVNELYWNL